MPYNMSFSFAAWKLAPWPKCYYWHYSKVAERFGSRSIYKSRKQSAERFAYDATIRSQCTSGFKV